jgi:hypothetical protein
MKKLLIGLLSLLFLPFSPTSVLAQTYPTDIQTLEVQDANIREIQIVPGGGFNNSSVALANEERFYIVNLTDQTQTVWVEVFKNRVMTFELARIPPFSSSIVFKLDRETCYELYTLQNPDARSRLVFGGGSCTTAQGAVVVEKVGVASPTPAPTTAAKPTVAPSPQPKASATLPATGPNDWIFLSLMVLTGLGLNYLQNKKFK